MTDLLEKMTKMVHEAGEQQETHVSTHIQQVQWLPLHLAYLHCCIFSVYTRCPLYYIYIILYIYIYICIRTAEIND